MNIVRRKLAERKYKKALRQRDQDYRRKKDTLKKQEAFDKWFVVWDVDIQESRVEYDRYRTSYWRNKAIEKMVELPKQDWNTEYGDGFWDRSRLTGELVLTDKGVAHIRAEVRKERLEGSEMFFRWALVIIAILGVLSTISSLIVGINSGHTD